MSVYNIDPAPPAGDASSALENVVSRSERRRTANESPPDLSAFEALVTRRIRLSTGNDLDIGTAQPEVRK